MREGSKLEGSTAHEGLGSSRIIGQEEFIYICMMHSIRIYVFRSYIYIVDEVHKYE